MDANHFTCFLSEEKEKFLIKNDYTLQECWTKPQDFIGTLYSLIIRDNPKEVFFEGEWSLCSDYIYKFYNKYNNCTTPLTIL